MMKDPRSRSYGEPLATSLDMCVPVFMGMEVFWGQILSPSGKISKGAILLKKRSRES
jgi:hypothetical protein